MRIPDEIRGKIPQLANVPEIGEITGMLRVSECIARGEIVVVDEASQRFGVSLLEVVAGAGRERTA